MTHARVVVAALAAALVGIGCGSSPGRTCQPVNAWSSSAFSCSSAAVPTGEPEPIAGLEDEPDWDDSEPEPEPAPEPESTPDADSASETADADAIADSAPDSDADSSPDSDPASDATAQPEPEPEPEPAQAVAAIVGNEIQIQGKIEFEAGNATLTAESQTILDEVAKVMNDNTDIRRVRIDVQTDAGSRRASKKLAKKRARALRKYLTQQGVKKRRIKAKGSSKKGSDDLEGDVISFKIVKRR